MHNITQHNNISFIQYNFQNVNSQLELRDKIDQNEIQREQQPQPKKMKTSLFGLIQTRLLQIHKQ